MSESVLQYATRQLKPLALAGLCAALLATLSRGATTPPPGSVPAASLSGPAHVIDGDTIVIGDAHIRLEGIDAPEASQRCGGEWFGTWACGEAATRALTELVAGRDVRCDVRGHDVYRRLLAVCYAGPVELNAEMVHRGLAWAFIKYSRNYVAAEADARAAKVGVWQGTAEPPWEYRHKKWAIGVTGAPQGCAIKGNLTRHGRIYHMPWSPWYDKTRIDTAKGERWFCSEAEAITAGWRSALSP